MKLQYVVLLFPKYGYMTMRVQLLCQNNIWVFDSDVIITSHFVWEPPEIALCIDVHKRLVPAFHDVIFHKHIFK